MTQLSPNPETTLTALKEFDPDRYYPAYLSSVRGVFVAMSREDFAESMNREWLWFQGLVEKVRAGATLAEIRAGKHNNLLQERLDNLTRQRETEAQPQTAWLAELEQLEEQVRETHYERARGLYVKSPLTTSDEQGQRTSLPIGVRLTDRQVAEMGERGIALLVENGTLEDTRNAPPPRPKRVAPPAASTPSTTREHVQSLPPIEPVANPTRDWKMGKLRRALLERNVTVPVSLPVRLDDRIRHEVGVWLSEIEDWVRRALRGEQLFVAYFAGIEIDVKAQLEAAREREASRAARHARVHEKYDALLAAAAAAESKATGLQDAFEREPTPESFAASEAAKQVAKNARAAANQYRDSELAIVDPGAYRIPGTTWQGAPS